MEKIIKEILHNELNEVARSIEEIEGLGTVNKVFDVKGNDADYIIRLNEDLQKEVEYRKEKWCIENAISLRIPSPKVLSIGICNKVFFMVQEKIVGVNGSYSKGEERGLIWENLGRYAAVFQQIKKIEDEKVNENEFHDNWQSRLRYNLNELHENDSLLKKKILSRDEQMMAIKAFASLKTKQFTVGLVHGDLCPRNVMLAEGTVYLLDWGTAEINICPHTEIGIVLMSEEANEGEFHLFLKGLGISVSEFRTMEEEVGILNLLHRLDKYRWATDNCVENIKEYETMVKTTFDKIKMQSFNS